MLRIIHFSDTHLGFSDLAMIKAVGIIPIKEQYQQIFLIAHESEIMGMFERVGEL